MTETGLLEYFERRHPVEDSTCERLEQEEDEGEDVISGGGRGAVCDSSGRDTYSHISPTPGNTHQKVQNNAMRISD